MSLIDQAVLTVRLPERLRGRLAAAAERSGLTLSAAARQALDNWIEARDAESKAAPYQLLADLVGCVAGPRKRP